MTCPPRVALAVSLAQSSPDEKGNSALVGVNVEVTSKVTQTVVVANLVLSVALMAVFLGVIVP